MESTDVASEAKPVRPQSEEMDGDGDDNNKEDANRKKQNARKTTKTGCLSE